MPCDSGRGDNHCPELQKRVDQLTLIAGLHCPKCGAATEQIVAN